MRKSTWQQFFAFVLVITAFSTSSPDRKSGFADEAIRPYKTAGDRFDRLVLGVMQSNSVEAAQSRLHRILKQRIESVDRICGLSEAQKRKLELSGRGDVRRLVENLGEHRQAFVSTNSDDDTSGNTFLLKDPEITALRTALRSAPFNDESLFAKTLRNVLTPEQATKYEQQIAQASASNKLISVANAGDLVRTARLPKKVSRILWTSNGEHVVFFEPGTPVELYSLTEDRVIRQIGEGKGVSGLDFSPDGAFVAISEKSKNVVIMNISDGSEVELPTGPNELKVKFSPDGKLLATTWSRTTPKLWSTVTKELVRQFDVGNKEGGLTAVFSLDGKTLAVGNRNSITYLFDVASGNLLHVLDKRMSHGLRFDPTGKTLAVSYVDGSLGLWDVATGKLQKSIQTAAEELYSVDWSPDGSLLMTAGLYSHVTLWKAADLSILAELETPEWTASATFSPDGTRLLFSGGSYFRGGDKFVEVWSVP